MTLKTEPAKRPLLGPYARRGVAWILYPMIGVAAATGIGSLWDLLVSLSSEEVWRRDFLGIYLLAQAVAHGTNPSTNMNLLFGQFVFNSPMTAAEVWPHPTPHPPPLGLIASPLAAMDLPRAALVWLGIQLACLVSAAHILGRGLRMWSSPFVSLMVSLAATAWQPLGWDLYEGQVNVLLVLLLVGAWHGWRSGRPFIAGTLIGMSLLIKQVFWPVLLLAVARRDWRCLGASLATVAAGYAVTGAVVGFEHIIEYFTISAPDNMAAYRSVGINISLWSMGWRLFAGVTDFSAPPMLLATPLIDAAWAAPAASGLIATAALLLSFLRLTRGPSLDSGIGMMICVSIMVSPIAWGHYLVAVVIPQIVMLRDLADRSFPLRASLIAALTVVLLIPGSGWSALIPVVAGASSSAELLFPVSFAAGLVLSVPTFCLILLSLLVARLPGTDQADESP